MSMHRHQVVQGNTNATSNCVYSRLRSIDPNRLKTANHSVMLSGAYVSEFSQYMGYALKRDKFCKELLFLIG